MIESLFKTIEEEEVSLGRLDQASSDKIYDADELFEGNTAQMCIDTTQLVPSIIYRYSGIAKKNKAPQTKPTLTFSLLDDSTDFILQAISSDSTFINSFYYASLVAGAVKSWAYVFNDASLTIYKSYLSANIGVNYLLKIRLLAEKEGQLFEYKKQVPVNWNGVNYVLGTITDYV